MSSPVTAQYLLEGAALALEQCGLLLRDANILYRSGSYGNAVVLAAFAREELGRSNILFDLRRQVVAGARFTIEEIRERCDDHVTKQKAGMLSTAITAAGESGLAKLLRVRMTSHPQSTEGKKADAELARIVEMKKKRDPGERHKTRMAALYVEPLSESQWNRPGDTSPSFAQEFIQHAVNDYAGRYQNGYSASTLAILKHFDPELYNAFEQWSGCPELPLPEWPGLEA
jgi:AbiV family abortive infection protein